MRKAPISYLGLERGYPKIFLEFTEGLPNTLIVLQLVQHMRIKPTIEFKM